MARMSILILKLYNDVLNPEQKTQLIEMLRSRMGKIWIWGGGSVDPENWDSRCNVSKYRIESYLREVILEEEMIL